MNELIKETGVNFSSGGKLTSDDLNTMNDRINKLVRQVNAMMKSNVNLNAESGSPERIFTFEDIIKLIPESRRVPGIHVRFLGTQGQEEYTWEGGDWIDKKSWIIARESKLIDGGEW